MASGGPHRRDRGARHALEGTTIRHRAAAFHGSGTQRPEARGLNAYDPTTGQGGVPSPNSGYIHIIDFTDPEHPEDVARYHVEEFGTHNIWVEDDVLYQVYYEGGARMVDVSGELKGNLANQGREMAVFKAFDPLGYVPNSTVTWGAQPHKGYIFFSDLNSGLWAVKMQPTRRETIIP
ncbi:MAG: hypothetical protein O7I93_18795 [Gemmatimonadetes bacterium]|nr:hypothetical protein [Gemmatimonadota bacterium]